MNSEKTNLITTLNKLQDATGKGDMDKIKGVINSFYENLLRHEQLLSELYKSGIKCTTQTDVIIAACRNKQADILDYLLNETNILDYLTDTSFDITKVNEERTEAFKHALRLDAFGMVEMLYDYWGGDLHWIGHDINKLSTLGNLLEDARVVLDNRDQQLLVNFQCLIKFNAFQEILYASLPKAEVKPSNITPEEIVIMLLNVLSIYNKYSDLEMVRIPHSIYEHELALKAYFIDNSSAYYKGLAYIMYEVYFRKLDFNVALLLSENLDILKEEIFNKSSYEEIECAIYHFIYRSSEDWRLYLPGNRQETIITDRTGIHEGRIIKNLKIRYDKEKLFNGPVIYFERKNFKKLLNSLKIILEKYVISNNGQQNSKLKKEISLDDYLKSIMRDHYSLRKIVYYIKAIENTDDINVLMIERVLQVIGEMLKTTDESKHLSQSAKSLLQLGISVDTITHLHTIREFLSHANKEQLSTRIDIANEQLYNDIVKDLKIIKQIIESVLDIYKHILDKSLLERGLHLLDERINDLPVEALQHKDIIYALSKTQKDELFLESSPFIQNVWTHTGLTVQLLKEIPWILNNRDQIISKIQLAETHINNHVVSILPTHIQNMRHTLKLIIENDKYVTLIKNQLPEHMSKQAMCPNSKFINVYLIQGKVEKYNMKTNKRANVDLKTLHMIKNFSHHWESMKNMLTFYLNECEMFDSIRHLNLNKDSEADTPTVTKVYKILEELEAKCVKHKSTSAWISGKKLVLRLDDKPSFGGIEKLHGIVKLHYTTFKQNKTQHSPRTAREKLISCLIYRVDQLKETLQYSQDIPLSQHLRRYNGDQKFRIVLEMLLADIDNILSTCHIDLMNKSAKLLREIDLGNVLDHGNQFLEVIGAIFDSHDLSTELLTKAMMFAKDRDSISALYKLFQANIDYETIIAGNKNKMNEEQKMLYDQFKMSQNWKSYAKLIPK